MNENVRAFSARRERIRGKHYRGRCPDRSDEVYKNMRYSILVILTQRGAVLPGALMGEIYQKPAFRGSSLDGRETYFNNALGYLIEEKLVRKYEDGKIGR